MPNEISVRLENLPPEVEFPDNLRDKIRYDHQNKLLIFKGVMSKEERRRLLELSQDTSYKNAIEALFINSIIEKIRFLKELIDYLKTEYESIPDRNEKEKLKIAGNLKDAIEKLYDQHLKLADLKDTVVIEPPKKEELEKLIKNLKKLKEIIGINEQARAALEVASKVKEYLDKLKT